MKDLMICITTLKIKCMSLHIKINQLLTVIIKVVLMIMIATEELICHNIERSISSNPIYTSKKIP